MAIKNFNDGSSLDEETNVVTDAQGVEHAPTNTITAESIATVEDVNFNEPAEVAPPLPPPDPEEPKLTETETEESDMNKRLRDINLSLTDESADETALEEEAGLEGLQATEKSLSDQIKALSADRKNISDVKQLEATGRGITAGGLAPLTMAELRKNSIQANILSAQLDAARGDVASAQTKIDKALAAKYDPIRAKQEALEKNLDLIINSPEYTLEQKARAEAKKKELDEENKEIEQQEADDKAIFDFSVEASKAGADALTIKRIADAKTPEEALAIMTEAGIYTDPEEKALILEGFRKLKPSDLVDIAREAETMGVDSESLIVRMPNGDIWRKPKDEEGDSAVVDAYVGQIQSGKIKLINVPAGMRNQVAKALADSPSPSPTPTTNTTPDVVYNDEEKAFEKDLNAEIKKLQKGGKWGSSWNYLHNRYPDATNKELDAMLNKDKYY